MRMTPSYSIVFLSNISNVRYQLQLVNSRKSRHVIHAVLRNVCVRSYVLQNSQQTKFSCHQGALLSRWLWCQHATVHYRATTSRANGKAMNVKAAQKKREKKRAEWKNTFQLGKLQKLKIGQVHSVTTRFVICHFWLLRFGYQRRAKASGGVGTVVGDGYQQSELE